MTIPAKLNRAESGCVPNPKTQIAGNDPAMERVIVCDVSDEEFRSRMADQNRRYGIAALPPSQIEITPSMIAAGLRAHAAWDSRVEETEGLVTSILEAALAVSAR